MCLLREAAHAWQQLTGTEYRITVGRRGKKSSFALSFSFADFPHVAGMQYAQDVDFGLRPSEYYGERLIPSILSGKLEAANMERSRNWLRIKGRLNAIIHLQETLDTEFLIARFRPNLVRIHCKIDAEYIIKICTPARFSSCLSTRVPGSDIIASPHLKEPRWIIWKTRLF